MAKLSIGKLQKLLWEECKRIIRKKYIKKDGTWDCYTCGKNITSLMDAHTAHFIPKSICGAFLKYDLRNLRVCCYRCNVWLTGNGTAYYKNMVEREGQEYVDLIFQDKLKVIKAYDLYLDTYEKYIKIV